jgi:hypothetical protein
MEEEQPKKRPRLDRNEPATWKRKDGNLIEPSSGVKLTDFKRVGICGAVVTDPSGSHVCGYYQFETPSGVACSRGHGGAETLTEEEQRKRNVKLGALYVEEKPNKEIEKMSEDKTPTIRRVRKRKPESEQPSMFKDDVGSKPEAPVESKTEIPVASKPVVQREISKRPNKGFEVREGDRLSINYTSAKLSIANYSSVDTDNAFYSRTLEVGDDAQEQWDLCYEFLKNNVLNEAKVKLKAFAEELASAKKIANG